MEAEAPAQSSEMMDVQEEEEEGPQPEVELSEHPRVEEEGRLHRPEAVTERADEGGREEEGEGKAVGQQ